MTTIYRIKASNGLFSKGGAKPAFSKKGKIWSSKRAVSLHLSQLSATGEGLYRHVEIEIIEYEVTETVKSMVTFNQWASDAKDRKVAREKAQKVSDERLIEKKAKEFRRILYDDLKKEFENE